MDVEKALRIGGLLRGQIVAGENGMNRDVTTIEVMEVPEVLSWATPGVLVLSAFYSIKDDTEKQVDIIKGLIDRDAAGIVIKLGRFIEVVPEIVKDIANTYKFPIITIPKSVTYNEVLTPINNQLFQEKQKVKDSWYFPLHGLDFSHFHSLNEAFEYISIHLSSSIFLEDIEGRLLYHSTSFQGDEWREDVQLFTTPTYPSYAKLLSKWVTQLRNTTYLLVDLPGQRNRLLLPLIWNNELVAVVHIVTSKLLTDTNTFTETVQTLNENISPLFMIDQIHQQKERISDLEWVQKASSNQNDSPIKRVKAILQFNSTWLRSIEDESSVIDYNSIIHHELQKFMIDCTDAETIIFTNHHDTFAIIVEEQRRVTSFTHDLRKQLQMYNAAHNFKMKIALSTTNSSIVNIEQLLNSVKKTMDIGIKIMPEEDLYLYEQMGIYVILLELSTDEFTKVYTDNLLKPLQKEPDLLETLHVYIDTNGNISQTSDQLFIHRRTVDYRMEKISEILNIDLKDSTSRFTLKFALMMQQLMY